MTEEWKPIPDAPSYIVSSTGRVARVLKGKKQNGYTVVEIRAKIGRQFKRHAFIVSRLVALAFIGKPPHPKMDAAHKDGDRQNNWFKNLEWKTRTDNCRDKWVHGTQPYGELHHLARINQKIANKIRVEFAKGKKNKKQIAKMFGVSRTTVRRVVNRDRIGGWSGPQPVASITTYNGKRPGDNWVPYGS